MGPQCRTIGPLLDKHKPKRILAIDMHSVREAAWLEARAMHVLQTQPSDFIEGIFPRGHASRHEDIAFLLPSLPGMAHGACSAAPAISIGCCGHRFSAARPESVKL
jgi:hypothetical protein